MAGEIDDGLLRFAGGVAKSNGNIGAGLGECEGRGASEAPGGAGDETGFAAQRFSGILGHAEFYREWGRPSSFTTKDTKVREGLRPT